MNNDQYVIIITGAAGTGKTTVQNYLASEFDIPKVVTHTTRAPRTGEVNGKDYYFETDASFAKLHLLEKVNYAGNQYGSSWEGIERALANHNLCSIVLDTKGAITYQQKLGKHAKVIFMQVNDPAELKQRMLARGDDPQKVVQRIASKEDNRDLQVPPELQSTATVIDNQDLTKTKQQLKQLVSSLTK